LREPAAFVSMVSPARGRGDEAESFNPRNDWPALEGFLSDAGASVRAVTGGGADVGIGEDATLDLGVRGGSGELATSGVSVAPHMPQKRFVG
jgi:hypothetical protein